MYDRIDRLNNTLFQHGPYNDRVYVMSTQRDDLPEVLPYLENLASKRRYGKVIAKCPADCVPDFEAWGARREGQIPDYYEPGIAACFMARYFDPARAEEPRPDDVARNLSIAQEKADEDPSTHGRGWDPDVREVTRRAWILESCVRMSSWTPLVKASASSPPLRLANGITAMGMRPSVKDGVGVRTNAK